jgi:biopolymer transport protein ExbD
MAFKPSQRRKKPSFEVDLNLAPYLSLFVTLIPMLLLTAMFQKVGIVNLYLPTVEEAMLQDTQEEESADFTLAIAVTDGELSLLKDDETLYEYKFDGSKPDLSGLREALIKVKDDAPDKRDAVLLLDSAILYETIIDIMDAAREKGGRELFPDISLADRVVGG